MKPRSRMTANATKSNTLTASVPQDLSGKRLDQTLAALFPDRTRSQLQQWW